MNRGMSDLKPYPFERLAEIRARVAPPPHLSLINLSIGEPQQPTPAFIAQALVDALAGTAKYPATRGLGELREAIVSWATQRFALTPGSLTAAAHVLPVNGTREALFAIAQCLVARGGDKDIVAMPNPFYQIYEGAALLAGAEPYFLACPPEKRGMPDFARVPDGVWRRCALVYVCSPGNPSGHQIEAQDYELLLELADRWRFVIVADECYSELYLDEAHPPHGLLQICAERGRHDYRGCLAMHSLSKRSNAPGLRSGFVAGDAELIDAFYRYRTYQGGAMPIHVQHASIAAWRDEEHVRQNRARYREKFARVVPILSEVWNLEQPAAGFYLWPKLALDDVSACEQLLAQAAVLTLPGSFLARGVDGAPNPGYRRLRLALVPDVEDCVAAAERIRRCLATH